MNVLAMCPAVTFPSPNHENFMCSSLFSESAGQVCADTQGLSSEKESLVFSLLMASHYLILKDPFDGSLSDTPYVCVSSR